MRRKQDPKEFLMVTENWKYHHFERDTVFQIRECDINQEIYGTPEYLADIQSALLNESATLFRRKYYNNGSHAGFILYLTDPQQSEDDVNNLRQALKDSKGPGNFRNLFLYSPSGKPDGIKLIPVPKLLQRMNLRILSRSLGMTFWQPCGNRLNYLGLFPTILVVLVQSRKLQKFIGIR